MIVLTLLVCMSVCGFGLWGVMAVLDDDGAG